jgi:hypothetical protein
MTIKPVIYIITAASLAFAAPASAQSWGSTGAVTVALTMTYQYEALKLKDEFGNVLPDTEAGGGGSTYENTYTVETLGGPVDERVPIKSVTTTEYGSKLGVWRWGNAQIIQSLVWDGTLPEIGKTPFLAGWSIVMVFDKLGNATGVVARHTNKTTVPINFAITPNAFEVAAISSKEVVTNNTPLTGSPSTTETRTYSKFYKRQATASVPSYTEEPFNLSGLLSGGFKVTPKKGVDDETGETITTFVYSPNATRLDRLLGVGGFDPFQDLIEGSISMSAGAIVDLDDFFPTPLE